MRSLAIEAYKKTLMLSREQREILVGLLLGDACLETQNLGRTYRLKIEQSARHEEYVRHLYEVFRPWVLTPPRTRECTASNASKSLSWVFSTISHEAFRFYAHQFYDGTKKRVPQLIHRWLTSRGLAYWFMDDGSMKSSQSKGILFNTHSFELGDVERLIYCLQTQFGLQANLCRQKDGNQIYISGASFEDFVKWIDPFILVAMRYKVPQARRTRLPKR